MAPVDLALLAGQRAQPQVRFRRRLRSQPRHQAAKVHLAAHAAALPAHPPQPARRQARILLQRRLDECDIGVQLGGPCRPRLGQPALGKDALHHRVMHTELAGDRPDRPLLCMVQAQDACLELVGDHHGRLHGSAATPSSPSPFPQEHESQHRRPDGPAEAAHALLPGRHQLGQRSRAGRRAIGRYVFTYNLLVVVGTRSFFSGPDPGSGTMIRYGRS